MAKRKNRKNKRRRFIIKIILFLMIVGVIGIFYFFLNNNSFLSKIDYTLNGNITYYDIYGIHMNFEGNFKLDDGLSDPKLVLTNGFKEESISWKLENSDNEYIFKTSDYINDGINLENLDSGTYYFLIKVNKDDEVKYFPLINDTKYNDLTYYSLTKNNMSITWENVPKKSKH